MSHIEDILSELDRQTGYKTDYLHDQSKQVVRIKLAQARAERPPREYVGLPRRYRVRGGAGPVNKRKGDPFLTGDQR